MRRNGACRRGVDLAATAARDKAMKLPGPDHPITIMPNPKKVRVTFAGETVAETIRALILKEADYPAIQYIPRKDARMNLLRQTKQTSHCPYKGDASYFSIETDRQTAANAVWSYEHPNPAVAEIAGHLAFYPDRVDSIEELEA
jgi:uncharacterized protein (DUF427 family)